MGDPQRLVARARPIVVRTARLTIAAVTSYVVARWLLGVEQPLTGPLTALLVVRATLFSTLTTGLRRVLSVVLGVLLAILVATLVGLTWWSLALVIAGSIAVGQVLRLGDHLLEVPISAMLVLGVGAADTAGYARIAETLVGAAVGVLINVVLPPTLRSANAAANVQRVANETAALLDSAAKDLPNGLTHDRARGWLLDFRRLARHVEHADRALQDAADSRRLNPRSVATLDPQSILRSGLDALEHSTVALRALFRSLADGTTPAKEASADEGGEPGDDGLDAELRTVLTTLLADLARSFRAFGVLVRAEADATEDTAEQSLTEALDALRETRARVTELLLVDPVDEPGLWQVRGALLAAVQRVLAELDVEEHVRRRTQWRGGQSATSRPQAAVAKVRSRAETARPWRWAVKQRHR